MKKEFKAAIAVILAVWIFAMGLTIGKNVGIKSVSQTTQAPSASQQPSSEPSQQPSEQPTSQQPTSQQPSSEPSTLLPSVVDPSNGGDNTSEPTDAPSSEPQQNSDDPASLSKEQIVEKMNSYMAQLKAEQNMTAHKYELIQVNVVDCSVPSATSTINGIVQKVIGDGPEEVTINFSGGQGVNEDGETVSPFDAIPPSSKEFKITPEGVLSAKAEKQGDNTVYTVILVAEKTTAAAPVPTYNSTAIGYLDIMSLDLPGVTISTADMEYPGSEVSITVDSQGKVINLVNKLPMTGFGEAKLGPVPGNATFEGNLDETWDFTY